MARNSNLPISTSFSLIQLLLLLIMMIAKVSLHKDSLRETEVSPIWMMESEQKTTEPTQVLYQLATNGV